MIWTLNHMGNLGHSATDGYQKSKVNAARSVSYCKMGNPSVVVLFGLLIYCI